MSLSVEVEVPYGEEEVRFHPEFIKRRVSKFLKINGIEGDFSLKVFTEYSRSPQTGRVRFNSLDGSATICLTQGKGSLRAELSVLSSPLSKWVTMKLIRLAVVSLNQRHEMKKQSGGGREKYLISELQMFRQLAILEKKKQSQVEKLQEAELLLSATNKVILELKDKMRALQNKKL